MKIKRGLFHKLVLKFGLDEPQTTCDIGKIILLAGLVSIIGLIVLFILLTGIAGNYMLVTNPSSKEAEIGILFDVVVMIPVVIGILGQTKLFSIIIEAIKNKTCKKIEWED